MESVPVSLNITLDPAGRIDQDLPCLKCGYNLRTLMPQQICPECGESVARSIRGDRLAYSDAAWVSRIARGTRWILAGLIYTLIWGFLSPRMSAVDAVVGTGILLVFLTGFWWFTSPEPGLAGSEAAFCMRRIARIGTIGGFLLVPLSAMLGLSIVRVGLRGSFNPGALGIIAGWLLILAYAGDLAKRVPDPELARDLRRSARRLALLYAILLPIATFRPLLPPGVSLVEGIVFAVLVIVMVPLMILSFWSIILFVTFRKRLNNAGEPTLPLAGRRKESSALDASRRRSRRSPCV